MFMKREYPRISNILVGNNRRLRGYLKLLDFILPPFENGERMRFGVEDDLVEVVPIVVVSEQQPQILECLGQEVTGHGILL